MALLPTCLPILAASFRPAHHAITLSPLLLAWRRATVGLCAPQAPLAADELTNAQIIAAGRARIATQESQQPSVWEPVGVTAEDTGGPGRGAGGGQRSGSTPPFRPFAFISG